MGIHELTLPTGLGVRGRGIDVPEGAYLFVALADRDLWELRHAIEYAFLWVVAGALVLALMGGVLMSFGVLARVEAISRASRLIVAGDLRQRIVVRGTDDEFDHLAASLNVMLDRIQSLMEGVRQVTVDIAHDLRTPLSRHRQRMEMALLQGQTADELRGALEESVGEVDAILQTFGALLNIARLESGADPPIFANLDLADLLRSVTEAYTAVAEERQQSLVLRLSSDSLTLFGSRELLAQLFANLIENALRHTPDGTIVEVSAAAGSRGVLVRVSDNGPGIPVALRQSVFRPFFRLDASRATPGTGLGLSLAAAVISMHHATISLADNCPGLVVEVSFSSEKDPAADAVSPGWVHTAEFAARWLMPLSLSDRTAAAVYALRLRNFDFIGLNQYVPQERPRRAVGWISSLEAGPLWLSRMLRWLLKSTHNRLRSRGAGETSHDQH